MCGITLPTHQPGFSDLHTPTPLANTQCPPDPQPHDVVGQRHSHCLCGHCRTLTNSPLPLGPPQTSWLYKVDHYFLPLLKTFHLVLESRPNHLKGPTSSGATSLSTARPPQTTLPFYLGSPAYLAFTQPPCRRTFAHAVSSAWAMAPFSPWLLPIRPASLFLRRYLTSIAKSSPY